MGNGKCIIDLFITGASHSAPVPVVCKFQAQGTPQLDFVILIYHNHASLTISH